MCLATFQVKEWVKMDILKGLFFVVLIYGSTALPTVEEEDLSIYFDYVDPHARLVGGNQAALGSHPHMVALTTGTLSRSFQCGGSIVTPRYVLTAAHCVNAWFSWGSLTSSLRGTVGTNLWNSGGVSYSFSRNVSHPNYLVGPIKNDIAFLITSTNIQFTNLIQPVTLNFNFVGPNVPVRVAGWGRIRLGGAFSATLLEINTQTIDGQRCVVDARETLLANNYRDPPAVEPHIELCTFHSAGVGNCHGDSGSALTRIDNGQQVGVVSWGVPCAVGGPDMFVRISAYRDWILNSII